MMTAQEEKAVQILRMYLERTGAAPEYYLALGDVIWRLDNSVQLTGPVFAEPSAPRPDAWEPATAPHVEPDSEKYLNENAVSETAYDQEPTVENRLSDACVWLQRIAVQLARMNERNAPPTVRECRHCRYWTATNQNHSIGRCGFIATNAEGHNTRAITAAEFYCPAFSVR